MPQAFGNMNAVLDQSTFWLWNSRQSRSSTCALGLSGSHQARALDVQAPGGQAYHRFLLLMLLELMMPFICDFLSVAHLLCATSSPLLKHGSRNVVQVYLLSSTIYLHGLHGLSTCVVPVMQGINAHMALCMMALPTSTVLT